jgi:hypothetical protein
VDSPAADVMADGEDTPAAPFITSGYFTLYLYQDFDAGLPEDPYRAIYDNAEVFVTDSSVLDNFDDNTKTGWTDFTFVPGFGIPTESGGQFRFEQPAAGQPIFSASQKTTRAFDLKEGERVTFSVDVVQGGGKDSFAILGFIPTAGTGGPGSLAGYGFAKSTTDILITKGIGNYFVADDGPTADLKQDNITMVLSLTVRNGSVVLNAKALDKDAGDAVLWEKTVVDSPAADVMADGEDTPAAPFITSGYFTLYLYQDFDASLPEDPYRAIYDNAIVSAPPAAANSAPIISEVLPEEFRNFLPATTQISFKGADDKDLANDKFAVVLNGTRFTTANGLTVTGAGSTKTATLGGLAAGKNYNAILEVEDSDGVKTTAALDFDTFATSLFVIEVEDYNFNGGSFIDNPVPIFEGGGPQPDSYANQVGIQDIDFNDTRTAPRFQDAPWRNLDAIRMGRTLDYERAKYTAAGGAAASVYDYAVGDIAAGEWMNYTRTFAPGSYEVYLRQSVVTMDAGESVLEEVTGDRAQPNQTVQVLGSFLATRSGFKYRNTPLTDGAGVNKVVLRLNGVTTLRLRQVTPDGVGTRAQNYLAFLPVADPGTQRATVTSLSPANNAVVTSTDAKIDVVIQNRDTTVNTGSVKLLVNDSEVAATVTPTATGATVSYAYPTLPAKGVAQNARLIFADSEAVSQTNDWSFSFTYLELDPATRLAGPGPERGIKTRVTQATEQGDNSLARAEAQLAANSTIPENYDITETSAVVNFSQEALDGGFVGNFEGDLVIPGHTAEFGSDNFAMEATAFLDLPAGVTRFGIFCDDGYKIASSAAPDANTVALEFHNGGPANETFDVVVAQAGVYAFRLVWYERGGGAHVEWFTVNRTTGEKTLVNATGGVAAYTSAVAAPAVQLVSSATVAGTYSPVANAVVDTNARTLTAPLGGDTAFYRVVGGTPTSVRIVGANVVVSYQ